MKKINYKLSINIMSSDGKYKNTVLLDKVEDFLKVRKVQLLIADFYNEMKK